MSVILARLLGVEDFGLYALLWTLVTFASAMQIPLTITPMMQIGAKKKETAAGEFFTAILTLQVFCNLISLPLVTLAALWIMWGKPEIWPTVVAVNLYVACFNQYEFFRRYFYTTGDKNIVTLLDIVLYAALGMMLAGLYFQDEVTIVNYLAFSSIPAFLLCFVIFWRFPKRRIAYARAAVYTREVWRLASPLLISTIAVFISGHSFVYATAFFLGASEVGAITAVRNLLGPLVVLIMALENGVTREAVLCHAREPGELQTFMRGVAMSWLVYFLLYVGLITIFSFEVLGFVYGEAFQQYYQLVVWLGAASIMQLFSRLQAILLRTEGDYLAIRSANLTAMWLSIACSVPLVWAFGLTGAMMSVLVQQSAILLFQYAPLRLDERFQIIPVGVR